MKFWRTVERSFPVYPDILVENQLSRNCILSGWTFYFDLSHPMYLPTMLWHCWWDITPWKVSDLCKHRKYPQNESVRVRMCVLVVIHQLRQSVHNITAGRSCPTALDNILMFPFVFSSIYISLDIRSSFFLLFVSVMWDSYSKLWVVLLVTVISVIHTLCCYWGWVVRVVLLLLRCTRWFLCHN